MQRTVAQHAVATSAADGIDAPTDASAAASAPPHPADAATPAKASSGNWIQARLDQLKNSVKKHFAPQLTELKSKLTTSASFSRDRIRTSGEQLQPALSKAKGGVVGLTRRVSHTSAHMQQQVEALLGARLVHDLFVTKKHAVEDDRSQFVMDSKASPTHFVASAHNLVGWYDAPNSTYACSMSSVAAICMDMPHVLYTIVAFTGCVATYTRCSAVNRGMRHHLLAEPRLHRYCVRVGGLPASLRLPFWQHVSGSKELQQTSSVDYLTYQHDAKLKGEWVEAIYIDVRRTYGRVAIESSASGLSDGLFSRNNAMDHSDQDIQSQLTGILLALASRYPLVGYCQGMDYIAAHLLQHVISHSTQATAASALSAVPLSSKAQRLVEEEETSFWLFVALLDQYGLEAMFRY
ncbi:hypothetical protein, variant 1 [Aphanomyces astaci]|uniref:Rab-GAP TBC domain-containing protein n=1 Tax=Aphanomyces astaci TaxID=112090 RepID=W4G5T6_APHAT|nr:hypothetical protein, variant 1 [Aphanomyces astaci]ETV75040.1 hypothetical protein, variant 1 [Aphanomyces astaci]|eukprot:XP_009835543.1 hypothetical protein, variant 1 [Aphanomyces astaci]